MGSDPIMGGWLAVSGWRLVHAHFPAFFAAIFASISFWSSLVRCWPRDMALGDIPFSKMARCFRAGFSMGSDRFRLISVRSGLTPY